MTIEVTCRCGRRYGAKRQLAGKSVICPACGSKISVPAAAAAPPPRNKVRCPFCHEYVPRSQYDRHAEQHVTLRPDGQQTDYATLPQEERDPAANPEHAPRWYRHTRCGAVTGMPEEIIHTYLTNPWFYFADRTFCTGCGRHVRQRECVWEETRENLQTYFDRLRAAKPELRPGLPKRILFWFVRTFY